MNLSPRNSVHRANQDGPPRMWYISHAVAAVVLAAPLLLWGCWTLRSGHTFLPFSRVAPIRLDGISAQLFGWGLVATAPGLIAHVFLTCFDAFKHRAATIARAAGAVTLALIAAALFSHTFG